MQQAQFLAQLCLNISTYQSKALMISRINNVYVGAVATQR